MQSNTICSLRLIKTLHEAGIDPEIFCRCLSLAIKHSLPPQPTDRERFEYGLFLIQVERFILLATP
jgi:hypothetical protein